MKKLFIIIPILLVAIGGGFLLAQGNLFTKAEAKLTAGEAKKIALELYPGTIVGFEFDHDDRQPHYEIDIESNGERVEVEVNAVTSKAIVKEREAIKNSGSITSKAKVSQDDAINTAVLHYAKETSQEIDTKDFTKYVREVALDEDDNRLVYDIELRTTSEKVDVEVDANTGKIVKFQVEPSKNSTGQDATLVIDLEAATKIALSKASGTLVKAEFDKDDNVYEIEIRNGKMDYEFEIDAQTGAIISYEEDLED